jgi:hypothetical protein
MRTGVTEPLQKLSEYKAWEKVPPESPYGSLDALLKAEIGVDVKESYEVVRLRSNGGDRRSAKFQSTHRTLKRGETADYLTARIARDNPDILQRMKTGCGSAGRSSEAATHTQRRNAKK